MLRPIVLTLVLVLPGILAARVAGDPAGANRAREYLLQMRVEFGEISTKNFQVFYTGKREFARERIELLESTRRNFLGFMRRLNLRIDPDHGKLPVILFDSGAQMRRFQGLAADGRQLPEWAAGYYDPVHNWSVFYNQRQGDDIREIEARLNQMARRLMNMEGGPDVLLMVTTPSGPVKKSKRQIAAEMEAEWARITSTLIEFNTIVTQHEGAHQLAYNVGVQSREHDYPFWVSEGLACVFEVPRSKGNRQGAARINTDRLALFQATGKQHAELGIRRLLSYEPTNNDAGMIEARYAESWALFDYLFRRHATALSAYLRHLSGPDRAGIFDDRVKEFERFFKKPIDQLQADFDKYVALMARK